MSSKILLLAISVIISCVERNLTMEIQNADEVRRSGKQFENGRDYHESDYGNRNYIHKFECPFPYEEANGICLYANSCNNITSYQRARDFCQILGINGGGGDLAFFRDANEFWEIIGFLQLKNPARTCDYYLGASAVSTPGIWQWDNPTVPPLALNDIAWAINGHSGGNASLYLKLNSQRFYRVTDTYGGIGDTTTALCRITPKEHGNDHVQYKISYPPSSHENV